MAGSPTGIGFARSQHLPNRVTALNRLSGATHLRVVGEQVDGLGGRTLVDMIGEGVDQVAAGEFGGKLPGRPLDNGVARGYCCQLPPFANRWGGGEDDPPPNLARANF